MITTVKGNLIDASPSGIIVHGCNAWGVMGSGFAAGVRKKWPGAFEVYETHIEKTKELGRGRLGTIAWYQVSPMTWLANGITQYDYGFSPGKQYVDYDALRKVFKEVNKQASETGPEDDNLDVHFPLIGCGLGGGSWDVVSKIIDTELTNARSKFLWVLED
jgi:O-acetyl-ADP-ribose deacetylase (regulator of RNase III)